MRHLAAAVLGVWVLCALLGPWLPLAPNTVALESAFALPGLAQPLGADELGRSIAQRLIAGASISCGVGAMVTLCAATLGVLVGVGCARFGGVFDLLVARVIDVFMAFPGSLLAIALAGVLGPGVGNVVIALCAVSWVGFARLARGQALALLARGHVQAATALGSGGFAIWTRHLLPLMVAPLVVEASFVLAAAVLAEAGLSFLGLGVQPPQASWGSMIRQATQFMLVAPHLLLWPSLALASLAISANLLGDWLRDRWQLRR